MPAVSSQICQDDVNDVSKEAYCHNMLGKGKTCPRQTRMVIAVHQTCKDCNMHSAMSHDPMGRDYLAHTRCLSKPHVVIPSEILIARIFQGQKVCSGLEEETPCHSDSAHK